MKNIMSYLLVVFSLMSYQLAQAEESCESKGIKLSQLMYVGTELKPLLPHDGTHCSVVKASNDEEARPKCKARGKAALNPGNPQYQPDGTYSHGSEKNNNLGYYFCVNMNKHEMCNERIERLSSTMDIRWVGTGNTKDGRDRNDGNCECKKTGEPNAKWMVCPNTREEIKAIQRGGSTGCTDPALTKNDAGACVCIVGGLPPMAGKASNCPKEPVAPPAQAVTVNDADFDECFTDIKRANEACSEAGLKAIETCSKEAPENNKNITEAQRILSLGTDVLMAGKAGTGALAACTTIGLSGAGAAGLLGLLKEKCNSELNNCKKGCEDVKAYSEQDPTARMNACKEKLGDKWSNAHALRFAELADTYKGSADNSEKFCKGDVQNASTEIDSALNSLVNSVQNADICRCQLTAGSTGTDCNNVPSVATCAQNPAQAGCSLTSLGCAPGSTSANCANTAVTTNMGGSGVGAPSGFATAGNFSSAGGGGASKVQIGDGDLSGLYAEARPFGSGTATVDAGSPFGSPSGGSNPGGSPANFGSGSDGNAGGGKEGDGSDKGFAGLFQSAKGAVMGMFGGSNNNSTGAKKTDGKSFKNDVNGFRPKVPPVRGMANANEFGGKNRDIWKTMNERYGDQYHTFITVENPSK